MSVKPLVALAILWTLPACLASHGFFDEPCDDIPTCEMGYASVASCEGMADCYESTLCGTTISCGFSELPCMAIPVCLPGETEVPRCIPGSCRLVSACGSTIICAPESMCEAYPFCPPGFEETDVCEEECFEETVCGVTIFCREALCASPPPCFDATSEVLSIGDGPCPNGPQTDACYDDQDSCEYCYENVESPCAELSHCLTACPFSATQIRGPEQCDREGRCYFVDHASGRAWCTGGIPPFCDQAPSCGRGEEEIGLVDECTGRSCRFVSSCGLTIQCSDPGNIDG